MQTSSRTGLNSATTLKMESLVPVATAIALQLAACASSEPVDSTVAVGSTPLTAERTVVRVESDNDRETEWLSGLNQLSYDAASGHLFGLDRYSRLIVEFDRNGALVRSYGSVGPGPGEFTGPMEFIVSADEISVLDNGAGKLVNFDRAGSLRDEVPLDGYYTDFARLGDDRIAAAPGTVAAIDIFSDSGTLLDGFGSGFPVPEDCSCMLETYADDGVVVIDPVTPQVFLMDHVGEIQRSITFDDSVPELRLWREEVQWAIEEAAAEGRRMTKRYISDHTWLGATVLALAVSPADVMESGWQLWVLDMEEGELLARFGYSRADVGSKIASGGGGVLYATDASGAEVLEYRLPEGAW